MTTKAQLREQEEAIARLHEWVKPGDTLYTVLRHVSRSGMSRHIDVYKLTDDGPIYLSHYAALATGYKMARSGDGVNMGGCGMDMGFALVYAIGQAMWPDGWACIASLPADDRFRCPSNWHSNNPRQGQEWHDSGGYALQHRWM